MPTLPDVLIQVLIGAIPLGVAYLAYRSATDANKRNAAMEDRKVDVAAFDRAQNIYERGLDQLEQQLERARGRITELEEAVLTLRTQLIGAGIPPDPRASTVHITIGKQEENP
jgi:TolA-binding protein